MPPNTQETDPISKEAREFLRSLPPFEQRTQPPLDGSVAAWRTLQDLVEDRTSPSCEQAKQRYDPTITEQNAGPLRAIVVTPKVADEDRTPALYLHGGGYTCYSAHSSLFASIPLAAALNRPLISIDYPLAPQSAFSDTVSKTSAAIAELLKQFPAASLVGESAGGGLALSAINSLPEGGLRPRCLVLISPWTDLGNSAESRRTMADSDPILRYEPSLRVSAEAYAPNAFEDPDASPLFAEYDDTYPPTFILCGSRDILLSDSLRLHEKLNVANAKSMLEVYNGMFHSFPILAPDLPESHSAMRSIKAFLDHCDWPLQCAPRVYE
ncbi:MAG: hydrolase [Hyphococcus sp.]|nr:MAG: hydrolase [Marinicaulis sp.]